MSAVPGPFVRAGEEDQPWIRYLVNKNLLPVLLEQGSISLAPAQEEEEYLITSIPEVERDWHNNIGFEYWKRTNTCVQRPGADYGLKTLLLCKVKEWPVDPALQPYVDDVWHRAIAPLGEAAPLMEEALVAHRAGDRKRMDELLQEMLEKAPPQTVLFMAAFLGIPAIIAVEDNSTDN